MTDRILITGATGTNGNFLVDKLVAEDVDFQVMTRSRQSAEQFAARGIKAFIGDFDSPETLPPALEGVDKVFLLSEADPRQVEMQGNMIAATQAAGVRHLVKLSASCAGPDLPTPIKRWHYATEQQIIDSGIPYTFLRPNCFMQNTLKWARSIKNEGVFYMPIEDAVVSQNDARDIAAVAAAVLTSDGHEGQTYEITGPRALTFEEVAQDLSAALNKEVRYVRVSYEESRQRMIEHGMEEWLANAVTQTYKFMSDGGAALVTDVVARVTGNEPIPFSQFANDHAAYFGATAVAASAVH